MIDYNSLIKENFVYFRNYAYKCARKLNIRDSDEAISYSMSSLVDAILGFDETRDFSYFRTYCCTTIRNSILKMRNEMNDMERHLPQVSFSHKIGDNLELSDYIPDDKENFEDVLHAENIHNRLKEFKIWLQTGSDPRKKLLFDVLTHRFGDKDEFLTLKDFADCFPKSKTYDNPKKNRFSEQSIKNLEDELIVLARNFFKDLIPQQVLWRFEDEEEEKYNRKIEKSIKMNYKKPEYADVLKEFDYF